MRLIDADALEEQGWTMCRTVAVNPQTMETQTKKPTYFPAIIDAVPVKRGKWIKDGEKCALYKCTTCNDLCTVAGWANCIPEEQMYKAFKFCPNCGAQMKRSEDE